MSDVVSGLTVNRWRRYGHDRLYVTGPRETKIGWWDLLSGEGHPETPALASALVVALGNWKTEQGDAPAPVTAEPEAPAVAPETADQVPARIPTVGHDVPITARLSNAPRDRFASVSSAHSPESMPSEPLAAPWLDLATNRPGAEARKRAVAAREAAPVKSLLAQALGVHTDERAWRIGADGEEKVAAQLYKLAKKSPRWRFLHAIPVGDRGSDIDHLVIGPGGIFTVSAKHHPGAKIWVGGDTFMVDGTRQPYIRNSRHEATRAAKLLTAACELRVHVEGLVVPVSAFDVTIKQPPDGVHVVPRMQLARWLLRHGDILTDTALDAVFDTARRSTTWRT
jgi:hypothetical protein